MPIPTDLENVSRSWSYQSAYVSGLLVSVLPLSVIILVRFKGVRQWDSHGASACVACMTAVRLLSACVYQQGLIRAMFPDKAGISNALQCTGISNVILAAALLFIVCLYHTDCSYFYIRNTPLGPESVRCA